MKKIIIIAVFWVTVFCLIHVDNLSAQVEVTFPSSRYLNWQYYTELNYAAKDQTLFWPSSIMNRYNMNDPYDAPYFAYYQRVTCAEPFHYLRTDSTTTHTIYGVAIPIVSNWDPNYESSPYNQIDYSFGFDVAVYTGHEGDTTVTLVKKEPFWIDSGQSPDVVMRFSNNIVFGMYEFYFQQPITVTGLFFVATGMTKNVSKYSYINVPGECFSHKTYSNVKILDDSTVLGYSWLYHITNRGNIGSNNFSYAVVTGSVAATAIPLPNVDSLVPYQGNRTEMFKMNEAQQYYPIIQPRSAGVDEVEHSVELRLMPNPAAGEVKIVGDSPVRRYEVMDMAGRLVLAGGSFASSTVKVDIRSLPAGIYTVLVETRTGRYVQKLAVHR